MRRNQNTTTETETLQDRTGSRYEALLAASLEMLGYARGSDTGKNYFQTRRGQPVAIPGTFIQPDLVVRDGLKIVAILYVTHWSQTRSCAKKFWRTWEEAAQQKAVLENELLTINCIFEALPQSLPPAVYTNSSDIPFDTSRQGQTPIQFNGWYPAISSAMVEAFDATLVFPLQYTPPANTTHDPATTQLVEQALSHTAKPFLFSPWDILRTVRSAALAGLPTLANTRSRYRIGLLHTYLLYRIAGRILDKNTPPLGVFVRALTTAAQAGGTIEVSRLAQDPAFASVRLPDLQALFEVLETIPVRSGKSPAYFSSTLRTILGERVTWNNDLRLCLNDLAQHLDAPGFLNTIGSSFYRFDTSFGVSDALDDLANAENVIEKEAFVRATFLNALRNADDLNTLLQTHAKYLSHERAAISTHDRNWVFEMLLYMAGLNAAEDIQKRFREAFDASGHSIRHHAPFGGYSETVTYLLQGRDVCQHWGAGAGRRTLQPDEFRTLAWRAIAQCVTEAFTARNGVVQSSEAVLKRYTENKAMRIIGTELNGLNIIIEQYLGDLCYLRFTRNDADPDDDAGGGDGFSPANLFSWQTDVIQSLWGGRPLETRLEGISRNNRWLIKVQSSQDGNEGHKTKELAGRCRGIRLAWQHGTDPFNRTEWQFGLRATRKLALVLDGDWDTANKQNLYEAGWDWVGDVSELADLRSHIEAS